jgi:hypothetical protein
MVINVQLIAYALALFIALGIIFIGIREWFQPSIAARGFGGPLVAPADRDFPCHQGEPRHRFGRSHPYFAYDPRSQSGRLYDVGANADRNPRWLSSLQARGLDFQAGHSDSLRNGDPDVDNRRAVAKWNVANRSTGGNRATHSFTLACALKGLIGPRKRRCVNRSRHRTVVGVSGLRPSVLRGPVLYRRALTMSARTRRSVRLMPASAKTFRRSNKFATYWLAADSKCMPRRIPWIPSWPGFAAY